MIFLPIQKTHYESNFSIYQSNWFLYAGIFTAQELLLYYIEEDVKHPDLNKWSGRRNCDIDVP